MVYACASLVCG